VDGIECGGREEGVGTVAVYWWPGKVYRGIRARDTVAPTGRAQNLENSLGIVEAKVV